MNALTLRMRCVLTAALLSVVLIARATPLLSQDILLWKEGVMAHKNGIITAPLSFSDPYEVLGVGRYNGWYDLGYICANGHKKINPYARYKPVDHNKVSELNEYESRGLFQDFNIEVRDTSGNVLNGTIEYSEENVEQELVKYSYEYRPVSGMQYFYRLCDFLGYNANARPFICSGIKDGDVYEVNKFFQDRVVFYLNRNSELADAQPYEITVSDLSGANIANVDIGNMYLCCMINASVWLFGANRERISTSSLEVSVGNLDELDDDRVYDGYFFLADGYHIDSNSTGLVQRIFPLPHDKNNVTHFKIRAINRIPATITLTGISKLVEDFVPGSSNIISGNVDVWRPPSYYDYYNGEANGFSPWEDNNIIFRMTVTDIESTFSVARDVFRMSQYDDSDRTRFPLYVQVEGESSANNNSSETITFRKGERKTLYLVSPVQGSVPYDVENRFRVYMKGKMIFQTPWIMCN